MIKLNFHDSIFINDIYFFTAYWSAIMTVQMPLLT